MALLSSDPEEEAQVSISMDRLSSMLNTMDDDSPDTSVASPDETNEPAGLVLEPFTDDKPTSEPYLDLPMQSDQPPYVPTGASFPANNLMAMQPSIEEHLGMYVNVYLHVNMYINVDRFSLMSLSPGLFIFDSLLILGDGNWIGIEFSWCLAPRCVALIHFCMCIYTSVQLMSILLYH